MGQIPTPVYSSVVFGAQQVPEAGPGRHLDGGVIQFDFLWESLEFKFE